MNVYRFNEEFVGNLRAWIRFDAFAVLWSGCLKISPRTKLDLQVSWPHVFDACACAEAIWRSKLTQHPSALCFLSSGPVPDVPNSDASCDSCGWLGNWGRKLPGHLHWSLGADFASLRSAGGVFCSWTAVSPLSGTRWTAAGGRVHRDVRSEWTWHFYFESFYSQISFHQKSRNFGDNGLFEGAPHRWRKRTNWERAATFFPCTLWTDRWKIQGFEPWEYWICDHQRPSDGREKCDQRPLHVVSWSSWGCAARVCGQLEPHRVFDRGGLHSSLGLDLRQRWGFMRISSEAVDMSFIKWVVLRNVAQTKASNVSVSSWACRTFAACEFQGPTDRGKEHSEGSHRMVPWTLRAQWQQDDSNRIARWWVHQSEGYVTSLVKVSLFESCWNTVNIPKELLQIRMVQYVNVANSTRVSEVFGQKVGPTGQSFSVSGANLASGRRCSPSLGDLDLDFADGSMCSFQ